MLNVCDGEKSVSASKVLTFINTENVNTYVELKSTKI